jgi:hypothetical protein
MGILRDEGPFLPLARGGRIVWGSNIGLVKDYQTKIIIKRDIPLKIGPSQSYTFFTLENQMHLTQRNPHAQADQESGLRIDGAQVFG